MPKIIISFICLLISVILIITLILPKKANLDFSQKIIEERKAEIQGKEEYFLNLKQLLEELKNYQNQLSKIDSALPEDPDLPLLFDFLQKSASQSGLILTSVKGSDLPTQPALGDEKPDFQETKLTLTFSGSYPAFKNFLSILERSARLIEIESLRFSTPKKEEAFNFDLTIKIHSY